MAIYNVSGDMAIDIWYGDEEIDLIDVGFLGSYCSETEEVAVMATMRPEDAADLVREWFEENHPPKFKFLSYLFIPAYDGVEILRLVNHQITIGVYAEPERWVEEKGSYFYE